MKKTNSAFVYGAFAVACLAALHCGGDDSNSTPSTTGGAGTPSTGGSNGAGGGAAGDMAGSNNGGTGNNAGSGNNAGTNNGGANNGGANAGGANNGGAGGPTDGGGGTMMGAGGTQIRGDAGMCPATAPMDASMCTGNVTCAYPMTPNPNQTRICGCQGAGRGADGAVTREWNCNTIDTPTPRDGGGTAGDGSICPGGINGGDNCNTENARCTSARGGTVCICVRISANNLEWACN